MDINIEKLIKVVKDRRILYDTNTKEYYDRWTKKQLWNNVCALLHSDWEEVDENERQLFGKEVQKKWQSLRDCFRRELATQKNPQQSNTKKKTKYKYFDELEFLTPFTQSLNTDSTEQDGGGPTTECEKSNLLTESIRNKRKRKISEADSVDEEIVSLKSVKEAKCSISEDRRLVVDDDEAFLLSLLPGFREYTLEQKYMLRIELMRTMLKFKESQNMEKIVMDVKCEKDD